MTGAGRLTEVWRAEGGKLMAALAARLGRLDLAEDALGDALLAAADRWADAPPDNPSGWLFKVALRKATDRQRKAGRESTGDLCETDNVAEVTGMSEDHRLALFFHTAHPALALEARIALLLYHLGGLSATRIARAFLTKENTIHQRLKRARQKLAANAVPLTLPPRNAWPERLGAILASIEIIYDQSHGDLTGGAEVEALGQDALQLCQQLVALTPGEAEPNGLLALLHLSQARRPARLNRAGRFVPLDEQDSSLWSSDALVRAAKAMGDAMGALASSIHAPGPYLLRAHIQMLHMRSLREELDVTAELTEAYDNLLALTRSPVVAINRALVIAKAGRGPEAIEVLKTLGTEHDLSGFAPWHLALAHLQTDVGEQASALNHLNAACRLVTGAAERAFVEEQRDALERIYEPRAGYKE